MKLSKVCEQAVVETGMGNHDHTLHYNNDSHSSGGQNSSERDWFITGDEDEDEPVDLEKTIKSHQQDISSLKNSTRVGFKNVGDILQQIMSRLDGLESKLT